MYLKDLIAFLEKRNPNTHVRFGFGRGDSYRGYYQDLAFEPKMNTTVGQMLREAKIALGGTYGGYKGGEFRMTEYTDCWLAYWGQEGETIGPVLLAFMLGEEPDYTR